MPLLRSPRRWRHMLKPDERKRLRALDGLIRSDKLHGPALQAARAKRARIQNRASVRAGRQ